MRTAAILMILATSAAVWMPASYGWPVEGPQEEVQFANWLRGLREEALEAGISEATVEVALSGITPTERVIERDRNQPEFRLDFWTYLDRVASEERIEQGRRLLEGHRELLAGITARHGIPGSVLVAVWGIESNFGANQGDFPVIRALVTLAYDKRRAAMFRRELIHVLRILDQGHISLAGMQGSCQAILLGCGRKYAGWLNGAPGQPIGSLHYFSPVLQEVTTSQPSARYWAFNRIQVLRLERRWLDTENDCNQKGEACLGKLFPSTTAQNQQKRDDVDPQLG